MGFRKSYISRCFDYGNLPCSLVSVILDLRERYLAELLKTSWFLRLI